MSAPEILKINYPFNEFPDYSEQGTHSITRRLIMEMENGITVTQSVTVDDNTNPSTPILSNITMSVL